MPLLLTGGVELLEPQAVSTEPKERARTMATRVARASCEYFSHGGGVGVWIGLRAIPRAYTYPSCLCSLDSLPEGCGGVLGDDIGPSIPATRRHDTATGMTTVGDPSEIIRLVKARWQ